MGMDMWECDCGHVEFGSYPPEECPKCWNMNSFLQKTEDDLDDSSNDLLDDIEEFEIA